MELRNSWDQGLLRSTIPSKHQPTGVNWTSVRITFIQTGWFSAKIKKSWAKITQTVSLQHFCFFTKIWHYIHVLLRRTLPKLKVTTVKDAICAMCAWSCIHLSFSSEPWSPDRPNFSVFCHQSFWKRPERRHGIHLSHAAGVASPNWSNNTSLVHPRANFKQHESFHLVR